jgi:hypothetical protein
MIDQFSTVLLDMNDTFMFGADRFGSDEDYSVIYRQLGGTMEQSRVNKLIQAAYSYNGPDRFRRLKNRSVVVSGS